MTGTLQEQESILVSGAPHFIEGKLLSVSKLEDEKGNPTSTGEAQAAAVMEQLEVWGLKDNVKAFVFDTFPCEWTIIEVKYGSMVTRNWSIQ